MFLLFVPWRSSNNKVCVEVLQFSGNDGLDRLCVSACVYVWGTIFFFLIYVWITCFQPDTHIVTHTHTHTLRGCQFVECVFTTVVSIMLMLALLKNQNMNTFVWQKMNRDWKANDRCVISENIPVFIISQKKWKQFIVSLWRAFLLVFILIFRLTRWTVDLFGVWFSKNISKQASKHFTFLFFIVPATEW